MKYPMMKIHDMVSYITTQERIKQIKLERAQKSIERRNHIQRIRDEFDATINRFKHLLDELEKI